MKTRPVGAEVFHEVGETDKHDEASSRFSHFCEGAKNVCDELWQLRATGYFHWHRGYYAIYIFVYLFMNFFWTYSLFHVFELRG